jgi:hypothetical protein
MEHGPREIAGLGLNNRPGAVGIAALGVAVGAGGGGGLPVGIVDGRKDGLHDLQVDGRDEDSDGGQRHAWQVSKLCALSRASSAPAIKTRGNIASNYFLCDQNPIVKVVRL